MTSKDKTKLFTVIAVVIGLCVVVFFLKDRITDFAVSKGKVEIKAVEAPAPAADLSVQDATSGANLTVTENAGGTVEVRNTESAQDTTITRNPQSAPPPKP